MVSVLGRAARVLEGAGSSSRPRCCSDIVAGPGGLRLPSRQVLRCGQGDHMDQRRWKIGDLAAATGLTVRALRHFDDIGLLCPAGRSPAGHRWYTGDDVRRLYRIVALRQLGIPLNKIAQSLDGDLDTFEVVVRAQLAHLEQSFQWQRQLRYRLGTLLRAAETSIQPTIDELLDA